MRTHYSDVIMPFIQAQIKPHQSSASLAFVLGIHRDPVNVPHKWPVTWKMFPFGDVIMINIQWQSCNYSPFVLRLGLGWVHNLTNITVVCLCHYCLWIAAWRSMVYWSDFLYTKILRNDTSALWCNDCECRMQRVIYFGGKVSWYQSD